jgi:hypothetical protein
MPSPQKARVPHILQNDADGPTPILCGPASIQAILYGRDDARFDPPASAVLKTSVPVVDDQETIWATVKEVSAEVAHEPGFSAGSSNGPLICEQLPNGGPRLCWITHPKVMEKVIGSGLATATLQLGGVNGVEVQQLTEPQVPPALIDSISQGVGAALLIDRLHWVVVYRSVPQSGDDVDLHYHDPSTTAPTFWSGLDALMADIVDIDGVGASDTVVVGVRSVAHPAATAYPPTVPHAAHPKPVKARLGPVWTDDALSSELAGQEFSRTCGGSMRSLQHVSGQLAGRTPTRVLRVNHARKPRGNYYILEFDGLAMVVVDAETHKPRVISSVSEPGQKLPTILDPNAIAHKIAGAKVTIDGREVLLKKGHFVVDKDLVWDRCDQSRSMFVPFYLVRQPRGDGAHDDTVFVRSVDGAMFAHLTRGLRGI